MRLDFQERLCAGSHFSGKRATTVYCTFPTYGCFEGIFYCYCLFAFPIFWGPSNMMTQIIV